MKVWAHTAVFVFSIGVTAFALSDVGNDALIRRAREAASSGNHPTAIVAYNALLKQLPAHDPRSEAAAAEVIVSYFALREYSRTSKACILFLTTYPKSRQVFSISYLLAHAYLGLGRFEDAFGVFGAYTFELVRGLPDDSRYKVYEVLTLALSSLGEETASQVLLIESKGLWPRVAGREWLSGPVHRIRSVYKKESYLNREIEKLPEDQQAPILVAIGRTPPDALAPVETQWRVGLGLVRDAISNPSLGQNLFTVHLGLDWPSSELGWWFGGVVDIDLLQAGSTSADVFFKSVSMGVHTRGRIFRLPRDWELDLQAGVRYRTSYSNPNTPSFSNLIGVSIGPELRYFVDIHRSFGFRLGWEPLLQLGKTLDFGNNTLLAGVDFQFQSFFADGLDRVILQLERTRVRPAVLVGYMELARIGLSYQLVF